MIPADTSPEASALQHRMLDALSETQRLQMAIEMSEFVRRLKMSAMRNEQPGLSESELKKLVLKSCFASTEDLPKVLR